MLLREGGERVREILDQAEEMDAPDPEPLVAPHEEPLQYPVEALPPTIRAAVTTYQHYGQQPISLVASSALSVAALVTQGLAHEAPRATVAGELPNQPCRRSRSGRELRCRVASAARGHSRQNQIQRRPQSGP